LDEGIVLEVPPAGFVRKERWPETTGPGP